MTDLEMTKSCAEAMGYYTLVSNNWPLMAWLSADNQAGFTYNPLHDDAQAMALVKKFRLWISDSDVLNSRKVWRVTEGPFTEYHEDLNRAIVECVAKMQAAKVTRAQ